MLLKNYKRLNIDETIYNMLISKIMWIERKITTKELDNYRELDTVMLTTKYVDFITSLGLCIMVVL